jgi:phage recombination protein Bet
MTTALAKIADVTGFDRNKIELVKETIAREASDDELMLFLSLSQRSGLDPFSRQIYLIERRTNRNGQWVTTRMPQTGIDGLRLIADRTGNYAPGRAPTFVYDADGRLESATAYVMKFARGTWLEVAATAHYAEYVQLKKDGQPNQFWSDKPHIMLAKCAEALALRRAFPADLSGLYTADEIRDQQDTLPARPPVNTATGEVLDTPALPARDLDEVKHLVREIRDLGGDPGHITPKKLLAMSEAELTSYVQGMREMRQALAEAGEDAGDVVEAEVAEAA